MQPRYHLALMRAYKHPPADAFTLERLFYALSDPARLAIVRQLARVETASCSALTGDRPRSSMSHHFRILRESGLVATDIVGTAHHNRLRRAELELRFPGLLGAVLAQSDAAPSAAGPLLECGAKSFRQSPEDS